MTIRLLVAAVGAAAATVALASPVAAAPTQTLPDATLYCGEDLDVPSGSPAFPHIDADPIWITAGPFTGQWQLVSAAHYVVPGLHDEAVPLAQLASAPYVFTSGKSYGMKTGMATMTCELISRWDVASPFTVYAVMRLARAT